jgi:hypothetical protein
MKKKGCIGSKDYSRAERVCPNRINIGSVMREAVKLMG